MADSTKFIASDSKLHVLRSDLIMVPIKTYLWLNMDLRNFRIFKENLVLNI